MRSARCCPSANHGAGQASTHSECQAQANSLEAQAFESAASKADYEAACSDSVGEESDSGDLLGDANDADNDPHAPATVVMGRYSHATHHRDGLFSMVFKARPPADAEEMTNNFLQSNLVALKVTNPSMMAPPHDSEREARIVNDCRSSHIPALLDMFTMSGGRLVLVFPFLPHTFETVLRNRRVSQSQARSHLRDLFDALAFIHAKGIIHRDVKPSNLLLKSISGPAYLSDFGIAWSPNDPASEDAFQKITDVGTTCYRPPELLFGNTNYNCSLDLWAAGCVAAEATSLNGSSLFDAGDLGSELALVKSIFQSLGTPNLQVWPEAAAFRDWGKMQFYEFPPMSWSDLLPKASETGQDLVGSLVRYESGTRLPAAKALQHPFFTS